MRTYPEYSEEKGFMVAFEISNTFISLSKIARILGRSKNVTNIYKRKLFSRHPSPDVHITFDFYNKLFIVWEPYGDNSMYWIGPENTYENEMDIQELEKLFKNLKGYIHFF